jgi:hypothetical protein
MRRHHGAYLARATVLDGAQEELRACLPGHQHRQPRSAEQYVAPGYTEHSEGLQGVEAFNQQIAAFPDLR